MTIASTAFGRQITRRTVLGGVAAMIAAPALAQEQDFPSRPLRILVPYSAGGTSDTAARLAADPLSRHLGQAVVVENRGGAGGLTGTEAFFAMPADGYTLLLGGAGPFAIIPPTKKVSYSVERDILPLGTIWRSPQLFAVNPKLGLQTMADFLARARANPGKVLVGSAGVGALTHLSIELLKREAKIDVTHVPYRSTGGTLPALIGGHIDAAFGDVSVLATYVRGRDHCGSRHCGSRALTVITKPGHHVGSRPAGSSGRELVWPRGQFPYAGAGRGAPARGDVGDAERSGLPREPGQAGHERG
jgi:tripartite-type tricarboxylate transporter receptor subunit TctC